VHFGVFEDVERHLGELRSRLAFWSDLVGAGASPEEWETQARADLGPDAGLYEQAMPLWQSYAGLERYWTRRRGDA
jgi:hypothetical protein